MSYAIPRERDPQAQLVRFVNEFRENSVRRHEAWRQKQPDLYDIWRGILRGKMQPYKNNLHLPLLWSVIWGDVARKMTASWGRYPFVKAFSPKPDDGPSCRRWTALMNGQLLDANVWEKEVLTFLQGDLYGHSVSKVGWSRDIQNVQATQVVPHPITGQPLRLATTMQATLFDGPDHEVLDPLNFYPDPGYRTIEAMRGCADRSVLDIDDVRQMALPTEDGVPPLFDPQVVAQMIADGGMMPAATYDQPPKTFAQVIGLQSGDPRMNNPFERPVEIIEYWGMIPSELAPDGITNRVLTVADRRYLLRNSPNPFRHQKKPYVSYHPTPDPSFFLSPGKAEVAYKMQMMADKRINQVYDAADLVLDPVSLVDRNAGLNTQNLFLQPGKFIDVDGPPGEAVMPYPHNFAILGQGESLVQDAFRWLQTGVGLSEDMAQGSTASTPDRETARSAMARVEAQGTRLAIEQQSYEYSYVQRLLEQYQANDVQFCPLPRQVSYEGMGAILDPVTGQPGQGIQEDVMDAWDMVSVPRLALTGGTKVLNEGQTQQLALQFFQMVNTNPVFQQAANWPVVYASMADILKMPEVREWMLPGFVPGMMPPMPGAPPNAGQPAGAPPGMPEDAASQNMQMSGSY